MNFRMQRGGDGYYCQGPNYVPPQPHCDSCSKGLGEGIGNPIYPSTGLKQQVEIDYQHAGPGGLRFVRTYRSDRGGWANNHERLAIDLYTAATSPLSISFPQIGCLNMVMRSGESYCFHPLATGSKNDFLIQRGGGRMMRFGNDTGQAIPPDINDRVTPILDSHGSKTGYEVRNASDDSVESYDMSGRVQSVKFRDGRRHTYVYSTASTAADIAAKPGLLLSVADNFGSALTFTYNADHRLATMRDPAGGLYTYAYDEASSIVLPGQKPAGNLTSVTYPDNKKRIYWYNEQDHTEQYDKPLALTGISDENGVRFASFSYDYAGRGAVTQHAGGVEKYSFNYARLGQNITELTDPLGSTRIHTFADVLGVAKTVQQTQPAGAGSAAASQSVSYDANGNVAVRTGFNGKVTTYTYDTTRNLETTRTEKSGDVILRVVSTAWHSTLRIPAKIVEPLRLTTFEHDAAGNVLTKTEQATTDTKGSEGFAAKPIGPVRKWRYTYNLTGQLLTASGPRTDVADVTKYTYDNHGNLTSVENPLRQLNTFDDYDANGRVGKITDANNVVINMTYWPRGWLKSRSVSAGNAVETTSYDYDGAGQLKTVTMPDKSSVSYSYDDAHRLTGIADSLGNSITYTLDNMGNRLSEEVNDSSDALKRKTTRVIDALNRVQQITGAQ